MAYVILEPIHDCSLFYLILSWNSLKPWLCIKIVHGMELLMFKKMWHFDCTPMHRAWGIVMNLLMLTFFLIYVIYVIIIVTNLFPNDSCTFNWCMVTMNSTYGPNNIDNVAQLHVSFTFLYTWTHRPKTKSSKHVMFRQNNNFSLTVTARSPWNKAFFFIQDGWGSTKLSMLCTCAAPNSRERVLHMQWGKMDGI